jgi:hypothetical protein
VKPQRKKRGVEKQKKRMTEKESKSKIQKTGKGPEPSAAESKFLALPNVLKSQIIAFLELPSAQHLLSTATWAKDPVALGAFLAYTDYVFKWYDEQEKGVHMLSEQKSLQPKVKRIETEGSQFGVDVGLLQLVPSFKNLVILRLNGNSVNVSGQGWARSAWYQDTERFCVLPNLKLQQLVWKNQGIWGHLRGTPPQRPEVIFSSIFNHFNSKWLQLTFLEWSLSLIPGLDLLQWITNCVPLLETLIVSKVSFVEGILYALAKDCRNMKQIKLTYHQEAPDNAQWFAEGEIETLFTKCKQLKNVEIDNDHEDEATYSFRWNQEESEEGVWNFAVNAGGRYNSRWDEKMQVELCFSSGKRRWKSIYFQTKKTYDVLLKKIATRVSEQKNEIAFLGLFDCRAEHAIERDVASLVQVMQSTKRLRVTGQSSMHEDYFIYQLRGDQKEEKRMFGLQLENSTFSDHTFNLLLTGFSQFNGYRRFSESFCKKVIEQKAPLLELEVNFRDSSLEFIQRVADTHGKSLQTFTHLSILLSNECIELLADRKRFPLLTSLRLEDQQWLKGQRFSAKSLQTLSGFQSVSIRVHDKFPIQDMSSDIIHVFCQKNPHIENIDWDFSIQTDQSLRPVPTYPFAGSSLKHLHFPAFAQVLQAKDLLWIVQNCPKLNQLVIKTSIHTQLGWDNFAPLQEMTIQKYPPDWRIEPGYVLVEPAIRRKFGERIPDSPLMDSTSTTWNQLVEAHLHPEGILPVEKKATAPKTSSVGTSSIGTETEEEKEKWYSNVFAKHLIQQDQQKFAHQMHLQELTNDLAHDLVRYLLSHQTNELSRRFTLIPYDLEFEGTSCVRLSKPFDTPTIRDALKKLLKQGPQAPVLFKPF